jgi:hypothetical protein
MGVTFAQNDRGTITGTVQDPGQARVPTVIATNSETGAEFKTVATETGNYTIPSASVAMQTLNVPRPSR